MVDVCNVVELRVHNGLVKSCNICEVDDIDLVVRGHSKSVGLLGMPFNSA